MALAKDPTPHELGAIGSVQQAGCLSIYGLAVEEVSDISLPGGVYGLDDYDHKAPTVTEDHQGDHDSEKNISAAGGRYVVKAYPMRQTTSSTCCGASASASASSTSTEDCHAIRPSMNFQPLQAHHGAPSNSVITFLPARYDNFVHNSTTGSFLCFEQNDHSRSSQTTTKVCHEDHDYSNWEDNLNIYNYHRNNQVLINPKLSPNPNPRMLDDFNCFPASGYGSGSSSKENQHGEEESSLGWLYDTTKATAVTTGSIQESAAKKESCFLHKRPYTGAETMQAIKRQCTAASRKSKPKSTPSKDPQSIAAKNRRERISERLKILQDLVPNGSKVDLVTMLEKAISYVKFLQLQVKVLATDEFWPVQGGKAPDISQVKEAIDAILSSQRDSNSSSK